MHLCRSELFCFPLFLSRATLVDHLYHDKPLRVVRSQSKLGPTPSSFQPTLTSLLVVRSQGKLALHEIGLGITGLNLRTGTALNPYNTAHFCGGSSSGSGAVPWQYRLILAQCLRGHAGLGSKGRGAMAFLASAHSCTASCKGSICTTPCPACPSPLPPLSFRRCGGSRRVPVCSRHRRWRLHPHPRLLLRHCGPQAHQRPRQLGGCSAAGGAVRSGVRVQGYSGAQVVRIGTPVPAQTSSAVQQPVLHRRVNAPGPPITQSRSPANHGTWSSAQA